MFYENDDLVEKPLSKGCYLDDDVKLYSMVKIKCNEDSTAEIHRL